MKRLKQVEYSELKSGDVIETQFGHIKRVKSVRQSKAHSHEVVIVNEWNIHVNECKWERVWLLEADAAQAS